MTATKLWPLQTALYAHLRNNDAFKPYLGDPVRIYDNPPADAVFPYLVIGETRTRLYEGIEGGMEHDLRLHVFSRYAGRREIKTILDEVYTGLHDADIPLKDYCIVSMRFVFADIFRRPDRNIYQGVARFRAVTHPDTSII